MADEETIATILEALTTGIAGGVEKRRRAQQEEREFALKQLEIEERAKDRAATHAQTAAYRDAMLLDRGQSRQVDTGYKQQEIALKREELRRKNEADANATALRAGDQLRKLFDDKKKIENRLANFEGELQSNPDNPEIQARVKQLRGASESLRGLIINTKIERVGAKPEVSSFLHQLDYVDDESKAKKMVEDLVRSGRFRKDSPELNLLLDSFSLKFRGRGVLNWD